jgi:hypothetical protein
MGLILKDDLHDQFGTWPLAYIPYGGQISERLPRLGGPSAAVF